MHASGEYDYIHTHANAGGSLSPSLSLLFTSFRRKKSRFPAIVRSMRAFRVRVSGFSSAFRARDFFFLIFFEKRKRRRCALVKILAPPGLSFVGAFAAKIGSGFALPALLFFPTRESRRYSRRETLDARESSEIYVSFASREGGVGRERPQAKERESVIFFSLLHRGGEGLSATAVRPFFFGSPHQPSTFLGLCIKKEKRCTLIIKSRSFANLFISLSL